MARHGSNKDNRVSSHRRGRHLFTTQIRSLRTINNSKFRRQSTKNRNNGGNNSGRRSTRRRAHLTRNIRCLKRQSRRRAKTYTRTLNTERGVRNKSSRNANRRNCTNVRSLGLVRHFIRICIQFSMKAMNSRGTRKRTRKRRRLTRNVRRGLRGTTSNRPFRIQNRMMTRAFRANTRLTKNVLITRNRNMTHGRRRRGRRGKRRMTKRPLGTSLRTVMRSRDNRTRRRRDRRREKSQQNSRTNGVAILDDNDELSNRMSYHVFHGPPTSSNVMNRGRG